MFLFDVNCRSGKVIGTSKIILRAFFLENLTINNSSDVFFWANYGGGHKCLPVNTTGGTQVSSWANYRVGHFEILSPYFPCHA